MNVIYIGLEVFNDEFQVRACFNVTSTAILKTYSVISGNYITTYENTLSAGEQRNLREKHPESSEAYDFLGFVQSAQFHQREQE